MVASAAPVATAAAAAAAALPLSLLLPPLHCSIDCSQRFMSPQWHVLLRDRRAWVAEKTSSALLDCSCSPLPCVCKEHEVASNAKEPNLIESFDMFFRIKFNMVCCAKKKPPGCLTRVVMCHDNLQGLMSATPPWSPPSCSAVKTACLLQHRRTLFGKQCYTTICWQRQWCNIRATLVLAATLQLCHTCQCMQ
jgi:hypothetical protein